MAGASLPPQKLVVLLLDGFRWDYFQRDRKTLLGFNKLLLEGVQSEYLEPVYPVLSYPNWTTIGTGVYPDKHGITGNYMFNKNQEDREKALFQMMDIDSTKDSSWWEDSPEPIWSTATISGKRVFTRLWSRSDVPVQGVLPEEFSGYAFAPGAQDIKDTTDIGIQKLIEGFDFLLLYGEHIDYVGHTYGPNSDEMRQAVKDVDDIIYRFLQKLDAPEFENVNVVVLSDHGMSYSGENSSYKYVNLDDYIDDEDVEMCVDYGPYVSISPAPGRMEMILEKLRPIQEFVNVYEKDEIPNNLRLKEGKFVLDLHLEAKPNVFIRGLPSREKQIPFREMRKSKQFVEGIHGFHPEQPDMRGIFFARGPAFKRGYLHIPIRMLDVYQIFAHVLGLKALPNDGNWGNVMGLFAENTL